MLYRCPKCKTSLIAGGNYCHNCGEQIVTEFDDDDEPSLKPKAKRTGFTGTTNGNVVATLSYLIAIIGPIFFLSSDPYRKDPLVRFHAWQSLHFFGAWIGFHIVCTLLMTIPGLWFLCSLLDLAFIAIWILLMVKSHGGEEFHLPILGEMAKRRAEVA